MREDRLSSFMIRPFLISFIGNLIAAFMLMMVAADRELVERTYAMIVPPELMSMTATTLMIFGILLAVMRQFPHRAVVQQSLWLFVFFGLFSVGLLHTGLNDLLQVHHGHLPGGVSHVRESAILVWSPALVVLVVEWAFQRKKAAQGVSDTLSVRGVDQLHDANLWLCALALMAATATFGVTMFAWPQELGELGASAAEAHYEGVRVKYLVEGIVFVTASIQWLVLGSCFYLLRRFNRLTALFPLKPPSHRGHDHPPHPPM